jgi:protocatechuate 3,4-dioxygenase beta subunit
LQPHPRRNRRPYPADGSNGPTVLSQSGVVRGDIRSSFAGLSGTAPGVPLNIVLTIVSASTCTPLAGRAVYLWHCDRGGLYSLYSQGATNQNYLRGVQEADASGRVTFTSIYPGCYAGRWPHIHFEVFPSLSAAASVANKVATSQIACPRAVTTWSMRPPATRPACATPRRSRSPRTTSSATVRHWNWRR